MLRSENLKFRYQKNHRWVLEAVNMAIESGEIVGLWGVSGQGKTTLAKILAGYLVPAAGQVTLDGKLLPQKGFSPVQLIFQHPEQAVNPRWKIRQILTEGGNSLSGSADIPGLNPGWADRYPHELSGGELQRVAVARVLGEKTRFLIADEITTMLDTLTQVQIWELIKKQVETYHTGVLVVSHDRSLLNRVCHKIIEMSEVT